MQSSLAGFLSYCEAAHKSVANRYIHHVAHSVAVVGIILLWRPLLGVSLVASASVAGPLFVREKHSRIL
jgi:hypothetical protein